MTIKSRLFSLVFVLVGLFGIGFFLWLYFVQPVNRIQYEAQTLSHLSMAISDLEEVINAMQTRNLPEAATMWSGRLANYEAAEKLVGQVYSSMSPDSKTAASFASILNLKTMTEKYMPVLVTALEELSADPQFHDLPSSRTIWTVFQDQANKINPRFQVPLFYRLLLIDDLCSKLMETLPTVRTVIDQQERSISEEVRRLEDLATMMVSIVFLVSVGFALFLSARLSRSILAENQRNLNEIIRAKEAVENADRAKGAFLANMSHEIRTPMNAILGMGHLIQNTGLTERQTYYIQSINTAGQHLLSLLNDILDFSKIEAGHLSLEQIVFSPGEILEDVLRIQGGLAEKKGVDLLYSPEANIPPQLKGDPSRLSQILMNLVGNGIKFTSQGWVKLAVAPEAGPENQSGLRFDVSDSGIGMTETQLQILFKPFVQANASVTRQFGGTGLGLAISSQLCKLMGGWLKAESVAGKGSRFSFWLPFAPAEHAPNLPDSRLTEKTGSIRTLVSADHPEARSALLEVCRSLGLDAESTGMDEIAAALGTGDDMGFDLFILDWRGLAQANVAGLVRNFAAGPRTIPPMIIATTAANAPAASSLLAANPGRVIAVPVLPSVLYDAVLSLIGRASPGPRAAKANEKFRFEGNTVLLAEDNDLNQQVAMEILSRAGLEVRLAINGLEAVKMALEDRPDLILMDVQMPVLDGLEASRRIREAEKAGQSRLPIIAMTAHASSEDHAASLAAGMDGHLTKPVDSRQLLEALARWLPARVTASLPATIPAPAETANRSALSARCSELLVLIRDPLSQQAPLECRDLLDELAQAGLPINWHRPLMQLVSDFHFSQALSLVDELLTPSPKGGKE